MSLWMSPIRIILFFSCSFISKEVNSADRRLWSRVFIHLFSSLLSRLMKWLIDSNNMPGGLGGGEKKKKKQNPGGGMCEARSLSGHPHLPIPLYMTWFSLLHVKDGSVIKIAQTPRAKESNWHIVSAGWFRCVRKKMISGENVRLCYCLWMTV